MEDNTLKISGDTRNVLLRITGDTQINQTETSAWTFSSSFSIANLSGSTKQSSSTFNVFATDGVAAMVDGKLTLFTRERYNLHLEELEEKKILKLQQEDEAAYLNQLEDYSNMFTGSGDNLNTNKVVECQDYPKEK